jgi:hypothetical protein
MILYVNGDSHAAAAEAVNCHAFAEDDHRYFYMGRAPHPDNLAVSWGRRLADVVKASFKCEAESASSNTRILRTTRQWLKDTNLSTTEVLVVIQWSTWEREEWLIDKVYYQVGSSGIDHVPVDHQQRYKEYVVSVNWKKKTEQAHAEIWQLHTELDTLGVNHIFFNGNNDFSSIEEQKNWGKSYIDPYDPKGTYNARLRAANIQTVTPESWHFGVDGHAQWARVMMKYISSML